MNIADGEEGEDAEERRIIKSSMIQLARNHHDNYNIKLHHTNQNRNENPMPREEAMKVAQDNYIRHPLEEGEDISSISNPLCTSIAFSA